MAAQVAFAPAYLLQLRPYRETSQLLEVFSAEHGRVGLVARGVRAPRSRLRGVLQPFRPLLLSWREAGELGTLSAAETAGTAVPLAGERVFHGWYVNELILRLLQRRDPHPELYPDYVATLAALPEAGGEAALRHFERRLLEACGYGLHLPADLDVDAHYRDAPEQGLLRIADGARGGISGAALIDLRDGRYLQPATRVAVRALLRAALQRQLGGRELESRRMLRALRESRGAAG